MGDNKKGRNNSSPKGNPKSKAEDFTDIWLELQKINSNIQVCEKNIMRKVSDDLEGLRRHFDQKIDSAIQEMYKYVDMEIGKVVSRLEKLERDGPPKPPFDYSTTIVATKVPYDAREDVKAKAENLVRRGLQSPNVRIVNAMRTPLRQGRPGILKIELESEQTKIDLLRKKQMLKDDPTGEFKHVFIRSSKPHAERLMEQNTLQLLNMTPGGDAFRIAGNGRIVKKDARTGQENARLHGASSTDEASSL